MKVLSWCRRHANYDDIFHMIWTCSTYVHNLLPALMPLPLLTCYRSSTAEWGNFLDLNSGDAINHRIRALFHITRNSLRIQRRGNTRGGGGGRGRGYHYNNSLRLSFSKTIFFLFFLLGFTRIFGLFFRKKWSINCINIWTRSLSPLQHCFFHSRMWTMWNDSTTHGKIWESHIFSSNQVQIENLHYIFAYFQEKFMVFSLNFAARCCLTYKSILYDMISHILRTSKLWRVDTGRSPHVIKLRISSAVVPL